MSLFRAYRWKRAPFLRLLPPMLTGIFIAGHFPDINSNGINLFLGVLILLLFSYSGFGYVQHVLRWLSGALINCLLFLTGILLFKQHLVTSDPNWVGHHLSNARILGGTLQSIPSPGNKKSRIFFDTQYIIELSGAKKKVSGRIIIYVPKEDQQLFMPGDTWILPAKKLKRINSSRNPGEFDYALYCSRKNIYHQAFLNQGEYILIKKSSGFNLARILARGQFSALSAIRRNISGSAQGLAMALLIGYRDEVDKELLQAYTNTGVVHVIAVSGMHLGLIFLLLQNLLVFPVDRFPFLRWLKALLVLTIIWWFSGIAGAAASIIRAAFMFTLVMISKLIRKPLDAIQSLAFGAFALLCYNPFWLWDAGFQLSFAALLSIVIYQPMVQNSVVVKNKLLTLIWQLVAVTLSAQILTLPISIGQFHQAPVYFLAANLLAIPLSSIALITAITQWIISAIGIDFNYFGKMTGMLINWMNAGIKHFNHLPGAVIDQLEWNLVQTFSAYIIIIFLTIWLIHRSRMAFLAGLVAIIFFASNRFLDYYYKSRQLMLVVYQIPGKSAVEVMSGRTLEGLFYSTERSPALGNAHRVFRIRKSNLHLRKGVVFNGISIAIAMRQNEIGTIINRSPDYLVLTRGITRIQSFISGVNRNTFIVIDGSVPEWRATEWQKEFIRQKIRCHNTWRDGAFVLPLNKLKPAPR